MMHTKLIRYITVNICLTLASPMVLAEENHLVNIVNNISHTTHQMATGIIQETGKLFHATPTTAPQKPQANPPQKTALKKSTTAKNSKKLLHHPTHIAQQSTETGATGTSQNSNSTNNSTSPTTAAPEAAQPLSSAPPATAPANQNLNAAAGTGAATTTPPPNNTGSTTMPEVAEPDQNSNINLPNDSTLPEPVQSNDTTMGITGNDSN